MASVDSIIEIKPSQELLEAIESMQGIESMLKQAIREVLLSEEFLKAFAAAWLKTPILHASELNFGTSYPQGESK